MSDPYSEEMPAFVPRVAVKFLDQVPFPKYTDHAEEFFTGKDAEYWQDLVRRFPGITLLRQFTSLTPDQLQELTQRAQETDPTYKPPNFFTHYAIELPRDVDPDELVKAFQDWEIVEAVYNEGPPVPPPTVTLGDPRVALQGYLSSATKGIDALFSWQNVNPGGAGEQLGFVDIEQGWLLNHEDLPNPQIVIDGDNRGYHDHGTSALGVVCAMDNTVGGIGIAYKATAQVISEWRTPADLNRKTADAISAAMLKLKFGDVVLLETQYQPSGASLQPTEAQRAVYDAIRLATALGIVVVEPAANGGLDLDQVVVIEYDPVQRKKVPKFVLNPAGPGFRDSGAIIVGSADSQTRDRRKDSNFGPRVNCFAWGDDVDTLLATTTIAYTDFAPKFTGTSSASAIVAGAALVVQSAFQQHNNRLNPRQLRGLLADRSFGTQSLHPDPAVGDRIGVMPNLRSIIQVQLGLVPDLYMRDNISDTGSPHNGALAVSPDIILRSSTVSIPQQTYGEGSGTENITTLSSDVTSGQNHYLYVRARNCGSVSAQGTSVTIYWSPAATLITPNMWTEIGTVALPPVPAGNQLTVSPALVWPAASLPAPGHYCFVALIDHPQDPAPGPADFLTFDNYMRFVRDNNNVTWRNFQVISPEPIAGAEPQGFVALSFLIAGLPKEDVPMRLETDVRLPAGATLLMEIPVDAAEMLGIDTWGVQPDSAGRYLRLPINPHGPDRIGAGTFPAGYLAQLRLLVAIPEDLWLNTYALWVRQIFEDQELGRVTFCFAPPKRVRAWRRRR